MPPTKNLGRIKTPMTRLGASAGFVLQIVARPPVEVSGLHMDTCRAWPSARARCARLHLSGPKGRGHTTWCHHAGLDRAILLGFYPRRAPVTVTAPISPSPSFPVKSSYHELYHSSHLLVAAGICGVFRQRSERLEMWWRSSCCGRGATGDKGGHRPPSRAKRKSCRDLGTKEAGRK